MKKQFIMVPEEFWEEYYELIDEAVEPFNAKYLNNSDLTYSLYYGNYWVEFYPRYDFGGQFYYLNELEVRVSTKPYWDAVGNIEEFSSIDVRGANYHLSSQMVQDEIRRLIDRIAIQEEWEVGRA